MEKIYFIIGLTIVIILILLLTQITQSRESFSIGKLNTNTPSPTNTAAPVSSPVPTPSIGNLAKSDLVKFIGPSYNYAKHIRNPGELGISSSSSFSSIIGDAEGIGKYVGYLAFGPAVGNNFFIKSGKCDDTSVDQCKGKDRHLYVRNIPTGTSKCLSDIGITLPPGTMAGLIPGLLEDVGEIAQTPFNIIGALMGKQVYSNSCQLRTEQVGNAGSLVNETQCAPPDQTAHCLPKL